MIYELLIRDFTAQHSYQSLIDSFQYFKNLGINAIELMPVNEFDGNESWGYNPDFYFAPDKYYGPKNKLKEFIDKCHQNGMAVILDVVYNHCTGNAPEAKLYWDAANNRPAANNPWLNQSAPHPYSVFNDFNHTSTATQYLVQRSIDHWLNEYKVDGFRFDLAKGFTQTVTTTTTVENYDASRVANLKRYYDGTIASHPDAYMILEFLGTLPAQEEQEYATHGFMLWGNNNARYNQNTMGYASNSDISPVVYNSPQKGFSNPAEVGYMESHDEERTMFKNELYGNVNGTYNVKDLNTALAREEAAATVFFTVPGPKMIWQFEERGYDTSLVYGGSNLSNKPPYWEYMNNPNRRHLYDTYKKLLDLRLSNPAVFNNTTFTYDFNNNGGLVKTFQIADPSAAGKKVTVVANFDVVAQTKALTFQSTGEWTNYVSNGTGGGINGAINTNFTLTNVAQSITLQPGEYHVFVSVPPCTTVAPTGTTTINYCQNANSTALTVSGTGLLWYTAATGGTGSATAPVPSTATVGSTVYYVSQTTGCEGPRLAVTVTVTVGTPAPVVVSPVNVCQNTTSQALTATGTSLLWYTSSTGGTGTSTAPIPSTSTIGSITYYVSQTLSCGEGPRAAIVVNTNAIPGAPAVTSAFSYCQNTTAVTLSATGSNLLWYTTSAGGTGATTAPTPSTTSAGTTVFYVSQNTAGCESARASITVTVSPTPVAPTVNGTMNYCQNATTTALTATGSNLRWYTSATGGTGNSSAPVPSSTTPGSTNYYVSQTTGTCEGPRSMITVTVDALPTAPAVTSTITYCQNTVSTALSATGTGLLWFSSATAGTGSTVAPTPSTANAGSTNYYVSQANGCGQGPRSMITVVVNAAPPAPTNLAVNDITVNSAKLTWSGQAGAYFNVDYRLSGTSNWTSAATGLQNNFIGISNLVQGKTYDWRVSANCSAANSGIYTSSTFTTNDRNNGISGLRDGLGIKISPNPVTGTALIDYQVGGNGLVVISIYDMRGQLVKKLRNNAQVAGQYYLNVTNELNNLAPGTYFLKIAQNKKSNYISFLKQ
jgi:1,4-alpha-glucan branching enzyme